MSKNGEELIKRNPNEGHRERLLNRYMREGIENFAPHEVLELLLHFAIQRKDTKAIAKELLGEYDSMKELFNAEIEDIVSKKVPNVTRRTAALIKLVSDIQRYISAEVSEKQYIKDERSAGEYALSLLKNLTKERFYIVNMDNRRRIICTELISEGTAASVKPEIRKVIESVLRHNATHVMFMHNHPSGVENPSKNDVELTRDMRRLLYEIDVKLFDHIIVAGDKYISLKGRGLI